MSEAVRLYSTAQAAELMNVSSDYVEKQVHSGRLRVVELGTDLRQKWRIRADDLMDFIEARTVNV
jgi:excisionase family DNA binding protein